MKSDIYIYMYTVREISKNQTLTIPEVAKLYAQILIIYVDAVKLLPLK